MRLRSDIFVSALVRRVFAEGGFAVIESKGAPEAGAIAIRQVLRDGTETLFMPALQGFATEETPERQFEVRRRAVEADEIAAVLEKERRFDSDLWVVVLETDKIKGLFAIIEDGEPN